MAEPFSERTLGTDERNNRGGNRNNRGGKSMGKGQSTIVPSTTTDSRDAGMDSVAQTRGGTKQQTRNAVPAKRGDPTREPPPCVSMCVCTLSLALCVSLVQLFSLLYSSALWLLLSTYPLSLPRYRRITVHFILLRHGNEGHTNGHEDQGDDRS